MARATPGGSQPASVYAALCVPDFPVAVARPAERRAEPAAVVCGESPRRFVHAADVLAREFGVREGMALAMARERCRDSASGRPLLVLERDELAERQIQGRLRTLAETVTPRFEECAPGTFVLALAGLCEPYAAAQRLAAGAARLGLEAHVGVSQNRFVALCAARTRQGVLHVYPGQEAGFLQALPLEALPLGERELATLGRWGLRKVGELARLPEARLVERFGAQGERMARLARGEAGLPLRAYQPPERFDASRDFDGEIGDFESLSVALSGMLEQLCQRLRDRDRAVASLTTRLKLADGTMFERTTALPVPLGDPRALLDLVRIDLEAHPPGGAVESAAMSAEPAEPQRLQHALFPAAAPNPERLAVTLARLVQLVGPGRVGSPAVADTHRPGAAGLNAFEAEDQRARARRGVPFGAARAASPAPPRRVGARGASSALAPKRALAFRCFRPLRPAKVTGPAGRPEHVAAETVRGPVSASAGPWRVSGGWWTSEGWQYQEWDVEVEGRLYRICCEATTEEWFLAGAYD